MHTVVLVEFEQATYNVIESTGVAEVCLVKNAETAESFEVVGITTAEGTATGQGYHPQGCFCWCTRSIAINFVGTLFCHLSGIQCAFRR